MGKIHTQIQFSQHKLLLKVQIFRVVLQDPDPDEGRSLFNWPSRIDFNPENLPPSLVKNLNVSESFKNILITPPLMMVASTYFSDSINCISLILSTIFLWFCQVYFSDAYKCIYQMAWVYIYIWRLSPVVMAARRRDRLLSCRRRLHLTLHHQPRDSSRTTSSSSLSSTSSSSSPITLHHQSCRPGAVG